MQAMAHIHNYPKHRVLTRVFANGIEEITRGVVRRLTRSPSKRPGSPILRINSGPSCAVDDRRPPAYPKDSPSLGGLLDASFPAFGKARRSAVMTNLTLI